MSIFWLQGFLGSDPAAQTARSCCFAAGMCQCYGILLAQGIPGANGTLYHPATADLSARTRWADIAVVSANRAESVTADILRDGVMAIDSSANQREDPACKTRQRLVGNLGFDAIKEKTQAITPVPRRS